MPAHMYPSTPNLDCHDSEKQVFGLLRDNLTDVSHVFHSVGVAKRDANTKHDREIDFLIIDEHRGGCLALELKSGPLRTDGNAWYIPQADGPKLTKSPVDQAKDSCFQLLRFVRSHRLFTKSQDRVPRFGWAVAFTSSGVKSHIGPELPVERFLISTDLRPDNIRENIERLFDASDIARGPISPRVLDKLKRVIAPTFDLVPNLAFQIAGDEPMFVQLLEDQQDVFRNMSLVKRLAVEGRAGTGKTLIAMDRAQRLTDEGQDVLFLCANAHLRQFLNRFRMERPKKGRFDIYTFGGLVRELAKKAGIPFEDWRARWANRQVFWDNEAPDILDQSIKALPDYRYDAIVIDEGQDYSENWWMYVEGLLRNKEDGSLWVFFDKEQNLHNQPGVPMKALGLDGPYQLTKNYRNTRRIAKHSYDQIGQKPVQDSRVPQGVEVKEVVCRSRREMIKEVTESLRQLLEQMEPSDIIVLSPRVSESSQVRKKEKFGNYRLCDYPSKDVKSKVVEFSSLHKFKGLERKAVVLCELRPDDPFGSAHHRYMAASRAKHVLHVIKYADKASSGKPEGAGALASFFDDGTLRETRDYNSKVSESAAWSEEPNIAALSEKQAGTLGTIFSDWALGVVFSVFFEDEPNYPKDMNISTSEVSREQFKESREATGELLNRVARLIRQMFEGDHRTKAGTPRKRFDDHYIRSIVLDAFIQVFGKDVMYEYMNAFTEAHPELSLRYGEETGAATAVGRPHAPDLTEGDIPF